MPPKLLSLFVHSASHEGHRSQAFTSGCKDGVCYSRRHADYGCFARACGWQILSIDKYDVDLRHIAEPRHAILR